MIEGERMRSIAIMLAVSAISVNAAAETPLDADPKKETNPFQVASSRSCLAGHNPYAADTTARVRGLSEATLKTYLGLAGGGTAVDARSVYTRSKSLIVWNGLAYRPKKIVLDWSLNGRAGDPASVDDPVARAVAAKGGGVERSLQPEQFFIAGAKMNAMGLWRVSAPGEPAKVIGWYRARFMRHNTLGGQAWELISLEVTDGAAKPADIVQFCLEPGDVETARALIGNKEALRARKAALKAEEAAKKR